MDFVPHNGSRDLDDRLVNLKVVESFFLFVPVILLELAIIIFFLNRIEFYIYCNVKLRDVILDYRVDLFFL